jgi:hypothetical protein
MTKGTPNQTLQQTAGHDSFPATIAHRCPAAAERGRSAAGGATGGRGMDHKATAETLRRLLPLLEGVSVDHVRTHPSGYATVTLRIAHPASVARLACWAVNTNVSFIVWGDSWGTTEEEWASPDRVRYELRAGTNPIEPPDPPSEIQMLCAHLVKDLAGRGLLDRAEADRLLSSWEVLG